MTELVARFLPDGTLLWANRAYCRAFGIERDAIIGRKYVPGIHPDDLERVQSQVASMTAAEPEVVIENRNVLASGDVRWIQWTNRGFFDGGELVECQAAGRDITESRNAKALLDRANRRFRFLAEASAVLARSLDYETTLAQVTRLCVPFLADGCSISLLDGGGEFERVSVAHADPETEAAWAERATRRDPKAFSGRLRALAERVVEGHPVLVRELSERDLDAYELDPAERELVALQKVRSFMIVPVVAGDVTLGAMVLTTSAHHSNRSYDADDLELAVEIGRRAGISIDNARAHRELENAARAKDQFLATLAHELRNPMAAIVSAMGVLQQPGVDEATRWRALEVATRQVRQEARLVDDLLDVSRLVRGRVSLRTQKLDIAELVHGAAEAQRPLFEKNRQRLALELAGGPLWVLGDEARLEQVVGNLLDNAAKFSPPGTRVDLWAEQQGDQVVVGVRDEGIGIARELLPNVFDLFAHGPRTHESPSFGLGLGLTVVRGLVELHGGRVEASSDGIGRGTEVVMRLPRYEPTGKSTAGMRAVRPKNVGMRVLVVDDNADAADMLVDLLGSWGHDAHAVYDGESALETAPQMQPEIVLIDIGMPRMDGYETARRIRDLPNGSAYRLIALTGYAQPRDVEAALAAGFDRHVAKPVDTETLRGLIGPNVRSSARAQS